MSLNNPDTRRALRSVVQAVILLAFTWMVWMLADTLDPRWLVGVIAISVIGNVVENGVRSFKGAIGDVVSVDVEGDGQ